MEKASFVDGGAKAALTRLNEAMRHFIELGGDIGHFSEYFPVSFAFEVDLEATARTGNRVLAAKESDSMRRLYAALTAWNEAQKPVGVRGGELVGVVAHDGKDKASNAALSSI
jgi:hypothetical protein